MIWRIIWIVYSTWLSAGILYERWKEPVEIKRDCYVLNGSGSYWYTTVNGNDITNDRLIHGVKQ